MNKEKKHECSWDTVVWDKNYYVAGVGETLERDGHCSVCDRKFREVYIHSDVIDDETGKEVSLFADD